MSVPNVISIDGIKYTRQSSNTKGMVLVCGGSAGRAVLVGTAEAPIELGKPYTLRNARMVIYWSKECGGLLGLAKNGPKTTTRLSPIVDHVGDKEAHQVIHLSDEVGAAFLNWKTP